MSTEQRPTPTGDAWLDAQINHIFDRYDASEAMDVLVTLRDSHDMTREQMTRAMIAVVDAYALAGDQQ